MFAAATVRKLVPSHSAVGCPTFLTGLWQRLSLLRHPELLKEKTQRKNHKTLLNTSCALDLQGNYGELVK